MGEYVIALDQGTTSSRAVIFDKGGNVVASAQHPFAQIYPKPGWASHDPFVILKTQIKALAEAFEKSRLYAADIAGIGITNQRETTIVWDKKTGVPVCDAIVWQCRRTAETCAQLERDGMGAYVREKTGLLIDAYFSGTKIKWILDNVSGARARAEAGELIFGTVDTWLLWNLTGGAVHATDASNASRTMLFDIDLLKWDEELCKRLDIPMCMLPRVRDSSGDFGRVAPGISGLEELCGVSINAVVGDQQAALLGQGCIREGEAKTTYGTGCFMLANTGERSLRSTCGLLTSAAWSIGGKTVYALEGSAFNTGSGVQWLCEELGLIKTPDECERLARSVSDNGGVYFVSAFTGLGAPHWDMYARGALVGLTRGSGRAHIARAVLEGIAYQVKDLARAMEQDLGAPLESLRADGGSAISDFLMQFQADILRCRIERASQTEATAFGAAFLAGLSAGVWSDISDAALIAKVQSVFLPQLPATQAKVLYARWGRAVSSAKGWESPQG